MRRSGLLGALLATLILTLMMPGVWRSFFTGDTQRMAESLRPPEMRTLTLWIVGQDSDDQKLLRTLLSLYEKSRPGLRIYLRMADADELLSESSVLPDGVFYLPGDILFPEKSLLPLTLPAAGLSESFSAGKSGGILYGVPLWYAPTVLSLPAEWLTQESDSLGFGGESYFGISDPLPRDEDVSLRAENLPWKQLLSPGKLHMSPGVCMMQLMHFCPEVRRRELSASYPDAFCVSPAAGTARVWSYSRHIAAARKETLAVIPLTPGVSDRVRFFSLCRENNDAIDFLSFLDSDLCRSEMEKAGFLPVTSARIPQDPILAQYTETNPGTVFFPNAFSHSPEEMQALCLDAFRRCDDPVATLLRLR